MDINCTSGILSGKRIKQEIDKGTIVIKPFDEKRLNPNSYTVRLDDELLTYEHGLLDMRVEEPYTIERMTATGKLLIPGKIYLAKTIEKTETHGFVPMLEGRSSVGRLGLFVHATAGFGDNGFEGYWTLELSCIQPIVIYPGIEIAQLYYHTIAEADEDGAGHELDPMLYLEGKYAMNTGIQPSMLYKEFQ